MKARFFEDNLNWLTPEEDASNQQDIPRPPADQPHRNNPGEPQARAKGGRVVASNINHNPTEAQKRSGSYAKDHVNVLGFNITIENAKGSQRSGVGKDGRAWRSTLPSHYGYLKKSVSADGDHLDVYLGPHLKSKHVFVIDQVDAKTGQFDEHKTFIGFSSKEQALKTYHAAFSDGKASARIGGIKELSLGEFKRWLRSGDTACPLHEFDFSKIGQDKAHYTFPAKTQKRCAVCDMYIRASDGGPACTLVLSPIKPGGVCKYFERKA